MKKKIKVITAASIAASAFVVATPSTTHAAVDVTAKVNQAKLQMQQAYYSFSNTATAGKLPSLTEAKTQLAKAQKLYKEAQTAIKNTSGKNKDALLADLAGTFDKFITQRTIPFIDAYTVALKLKDLEKQLQSAKEKKDQVLVEKIYHQISKELRTKSTIIDRVYGKSMRDLLKSEYRTPATEVRDSLKSDVTVIMKIREVEEAIAKGDKEAAEKALKVIDQYIDKAEVFKKELTSEFKEAIADVKKELGLTFTPVSTSGTGVVTPVTPVTPVVIPSGGGSTGGGSSQVSVTGVTISATTAELKVDETKQLTATVTPSNATTSTVTWSSSNSEVATVDSTGKVTAKTAGTATITVKSTNGKTATCTVTVTAKEVAVSVTEVTVVTAPAKVDYTVDENLDLTGLVVVLAKSDETSETVAFADFATKGLTTDPANGTALLEASIKTVTITHTESGKSATQAITVKSSEVTTASTATAELAKIKDLVVRVPEANNTLEAVNALVKSQAQSKVGSGYTVELAEGSTYVGTTWTGKFIVAKGEDTATSADNVSIEVTVIPTEVTTPSTATAELAKIKDLVVRVPEANNTLEAVNALVKSQAQSKVGSGYTVELAEGSAYVGTTWTGKFIVAKGEDTATSTGNVSITVTVIPTVVTTAADELAKITGLVVSVDSAHKTLAEVDAAVLSQARGKGIVEGYAVTLTETAYDVETGTWTGKFTVTKGEDIATSAQAVSITVTVIPAGLTITKIEVTDASNILVTFEGQTEAVEIVLSTPLVHGATTVTFTHEGVEYTGDLASPYVDPAMVAVEATNAVIAYETITIAKYLDVAPATELKETAQAAIDLVTDETVRTGLQTRLDAKATVISGKLSDKVTAVKNAVTANNQISLNTELAFFADYDSSLLMKYMTELAAINTVDDIQTAVYSVNLVDKVQKSITTFAAAKNTVDQIKLKVAIEYGVQTGLLTNVDIVRYLSGYIAAATDEAPASVITVATDIDSVAKIQTHIIDPAAAALSSDATNKVDLVAAGFATNAVPAQALFDAADVAIKALPEDSTEVGALTPKADLQERLNAYIALKPVKEAVVSKSQAKLLTALKASSFLRVDADSIVEYQDGIVVGDMTYSVDASSITIEKVQTKIDGVNLTKAAGLVNALDTAVTQAAYTAAETAMGFVLDTDKPALQANLDIAKAVLAVMNATSADALYTALTDTKLALSADTVKAGNKASYWTVFSATITVDKTGIDTKVKIQSAIVDAGNVAPVNSAIAAVGSATDAPKLLKALKDLAAVDTALDIATIVDFNAVNYYTLLSGATKTTTTQIQTNIVTAGNTAAVTAAVTALKTKAGTIIDTITATNRTEIITLLQNVDKANNDKTVFDSAKVDTRDHMVDKYIAAIKTANPFATAADVQTLVSGVKAAIGTDALALIGTNAGKDAADELLKALQDVDLAFTNVIAANKDAYLADKALFTTALNSGDYAVKKAAVQKVIKLINAVVALNSADKPEAARTALVDCLSNLSDFPASIPAYLNLSDQGRLEVAELVLADRNDNTPTPMFAGSVAVLAAVGATNAAGALKVHADLLLGVNDLTAAKQNGEIMIVLDSLKYDAYSNIGDTNRKLAIAEKFKSKLTFAAADGGKVTPAFESLEDIKDAIDVAIAATPVQ